MRVILIPLFSHLLFAAIDLRTNIQDVLVGNGFAELGSITFSLHEDSFPNASIEQPVFIRIHLEGGHTLAQTLVNLDADESQNFPIFLAVRLFYNNPDYTLNADPDAVSIIRWIRGESDIWLRIQDSTSRWINTGTELIPPSAQKGSCEFSFGVTAETSYYACNHEFSYGHANRPANSRNNSFFPGETEAISSLLVVDMAPIGTYPEPDCYIQVTPSAFSTAGPLTVAGQLPFEEGTLFPCFFSGDTLVARSWDYFKDIYRISDMFDPMVPLCESSSENGLVAFSRFLYYEFEYNNNYELIDEFYSVRMVLKVPPDANYGFKVGTLISESRPSKTQWWGNDPMQMEPNQYFTVEGIDLPNEDNETVEADPASIFITQGGQKLARAIIILSNHPFDWRNDKIIDLSLYQDFRSAPAPVHLYTEFYLDLNQSGVSGSGSDQWIQTTQFGISQGGPPPNFTFVKETFYEAGEFIACPQ